MHWPKGTTDIAYANAGMKYIVILTSRHAGHCHALPRRRNKRISRKGPAWPSSFPCGKCLPAVCARPCGQADTFHRDCPALPHPAQPRHLRTSMNMSGLKLRVSCPTASANTPARSCAATCKYTVSRPCSSSLQGEQVVHRP